MPCPERPTAEPFILGDTPAPASLLAYCLYRWASCVCGYAVLASRGAWLSEVCRLEGRGAEAWQHARGRAGFMACR
jgi:hypothetical protein